MRRTEQFEQRQHFDLPKAEMISRWRLGRSRPGSTMVKEMQRHGLETLGKTSSNELVGSGGTGA